MTARQSCRLNLKQIATNKLSELDIERIQFLLADVLPFKELRISVSSLFANLDQHGILNSSFLARLFDSIERKDLVREVKLFAGNECEMGEYFPVSVHIP